ncbi:hypothetical protein [Candidatus Nanohalococcus occultus]|uniref:hypothetical protein n=1 Tax=Candidatus Nanohalococcus occultus TaxID=2978047 RepID=UPI0039E19198
MRFIKPRSGNASDGEAYILDTVNSRLRGNSVNSVNRAIRSGKIDMGDIKPDFDFTLEEGSEEPDIDSFTDVHPITDIFENSYVDSIKADTSKGFFRAETSGNENFDVWMPFLDEGKAAGLFQIRNPWTEQKSLVAYNGQEARGAEIETAKPVLDAAYRTARESVPECGIRVQGWDSGRFKSKAHEFVDKSGNHEQGILGELEETGSYEVGTHEHSGGAREKKIIQNLDEFLTMLNSARVTDLKTELEYGKGELRIKGGGYKKLTMISESAPYENHKEAVDYRLPEKWR